MSENATTQQPSTTTKLFYHPQLQTLNLWTTEAKKNNKFINIMSKQ